MSIYNHTHSKKSTFSTLMIQSETTIMGFRCLGFLLLLFLIQSNTSVGNSSTSLQNEFSISWVADRVNFLRGGHELQLKLDKKFGSGFTSKKKYLFGNISMQIKLVLGDSAGTVTAYYLSSEGANHDELDFEFLGNKSGEPYVVQTNVYASGKGDREQRIYLWFDPTKDFHSYGLLWTPQHILFMVDDVPIRVFKNNKAVGVPYPERQAMGVFSSLWNGDSWATQGGLVKIDWLHAPFVASYRNFQAHNSINGRYQTDMLSPDEKKKLWWVKKSYMIYDYCNDKQRYPVPPPECTINP